MFPEKPELSKKLSEYLWKKVNEQSTRTTIAKNLQNHATVEKNSGTNLQPPNAMEMWKQCGRNKTEKTINHMNGLHTMLVEKTKETTINL